MDNAIDFFQSNILEWEGFLLVYLIGQKLRSGEVELMCWRVQDSENNLWLLGHWHAVQCAACVEPEGSSGRH